VASDEGFPHASISGFVYEPEVLTATDHDALSRRVADEPFAPLRMRGRVSKRQVVSYGLSFLPHLAALPPAAPIPKYLHPLRRLAGGLAGVEEKKLKQALITFYPAGGEIGWHIDHPDFGDTVVVVSLVGPATLFLRGSEGQERQQLVRPRSIYVLRGDARWRAEHRVIAHRDRYSVAFRTLNP
jgi:alkylated DNA repair protein (DNA oxidative demethylase)